MKIDKDIEQKWYELHAKLVNEVISFCKEHNIDASEFTLGADSLETSIEFGEWTPATDSAFCLYKRNENDDYKLKDILISM